MAPRAAPRRRSAILRPASRVRLYEQLSSGCWTTSTPSGSRWATGSRPSAAGVQHPADHPGLEARHRGGGRSVPDGPVTDLEDTGMPRAGDAQLLVERAELTLVQWAGQVRAAIREHRHRLGPVGGIVPQHEGRYVADHSPYRGAHGQIG